MVKNLTVQRVSYHENFLENQKLKSTFLIFTAVEKALLITLKSPTRLFNFRFYTHGKLYAEGEGENLIKISAGD